MSAIATPEVELPTLSLEPAQLLPLSQLCEAPPPPLPALLTITDPVSGLPIGLSMAPAPQKPRPFLRILEEPKSNALRFRYQCEGRGAGALQGETSTAQRKTFPKVQICNYKGPAVVVVSCVTIDNDPSPRTHPHNLVSPASVGRGGCKKGVCTEFVNSEDMTVEFPHLGIQCVRRRDVESSLRERRDIRVDPFRQGFRHMDNNGNIDLNAVKLCFQAFLEDPGRPGKYTVVLDPVSSVPVFDAKAKKELVIMDMSDTEAPVEGGKKIILLCEKILREDIKVRFWDPRNGWEGWGQFSSQDVHKQYAITLATPAYSRALAPGETRRRVRLELVRPSDDSCSEPQDFYFTAALTAGSAAATPRADGKENSELLVNISNTPDNNHNIKLERTQSSESQVTSTRDDGELCDYLDLLGHNPMDLRHGDMEDKLMEFEKTMNNLSGLIESPSFSLSDAIDASLSVEQCANNNNKDPLMTGSERRRGSVKRSSVTAALETGSGLVEAKVSLHTPDHSESLLMLSDHQMQMAKLLTNCPRINDL